MKKSYLILLCMMSSIYSIAQDSCQNAIQIYSTPSVSLTLSDVYDPQLGFYYEYYFGIKMDYPNWFYGFVNASGRIEMEFTCNDPTDSISFVAWGPFQDHVSPCASSLNAITEFDHGYSNDDHIVITNALFGEYYLFCFSKRYDTSHVVIDSLFQSNISLPYSGLFGTDSLDCYWTPYLNPVQICMATTDSITTHNKIIATPNYPTYSGLISNIAVYRENPSMVFDSIGYIPAGSNAFIDQNSNPMQQAYRYKLSFNDTCGNSSAFSGIHKTIHLMASNGAMGGINLEWNTYQGFSYTTHYIYKKIANGSYNLIDSVAYNITTYTDLNGPFPNVKYRIAVKSPSPCGGIKSTDMVMSNESEAPSGIESQDYMQAISVYPNPFCDFTEVKLEMEVKDCLVTLRDVTGKMIKEIRFSGKSFMIFKETLEPGIYFIESPVFRTIPVSVM